MMSVSVRQKAQVTQLRAPPSHPAAVFFVQSLYTMLRESQLLSAVLLPFCIVVQAAQKKIHKKREVVPKHVALFCAYYLFTRVLRRFETRDA